MRLTEDIKNIVAIYPGRFHPFHKGHASVYEYLKGKFKDVYIATSDKVDPPKSPFSFKEKRAMMLHAGIPSAAIVQTKQPYRAEEILSKYDPETTAVVFAVSQKDMDEDPRFSFAPKKDGSASYFQPLKGTDEVKGYGEHGYIATIPTLNFTVLGKPMRSATELRRDFAKADTDTQKDIITDLYGTYNKRIHSIMANKINEAYLRFEDLYNVILEFWRLDTVRPLTESVRMQVIESVIKAKEAWSEKYKRSINCNNPKGFSQRAHCQGRKKNEGVGHKDLLATPKNTVVVDTPGDLDWYKIGQHFPTLDKMDPKEFGQSESDMVITFATDQEKEVFLKLAKRLGLKTMDIGGTGIHPEIHSEGKSPHKKGTKKYKAHMAAMHAGMNESVNYVKPQFDVEWEEANRYDYLEKLGQAGWIELANKGKPVKVTKDSVKKIGNTGADGSETLDDLEPEKVERLKKAMKSGTIEMPIVVVQPDGSLDLVAGNTRLIGLISEYGEATVWLVNAMDLTEDDLNFVATGGSFGKKRRFPTFIVKKEALKYKAYDEQDNMSLKASSNSLKGLASMLKPYIEKRIGGSWKLEEGKEGSYLLQLERDDDLLVLHIKNTRTGQRTEVRGKPNYEGDGYDPKDELHRLLDMIGKAANVSELMNGKVVSINPHHPDGKSAKVHADKAFNEDAVKDLEAEFPGLYLDLYKTKAGYILGKIELPKEERGTGIGTQVMQRIVDMADSEGEIVALTPDTAFGASSKGRLEKFYKRFGFVFNKGRNKDFSFRETMIRYPKQEVDEFKMPTKQAIKDKVAKLKQALSTEAGETKEMLDIYKRALKKQASPEEIKVANDQFKDLLKVVGLGAFTVVPIPGGSIFLIAFEKVLNKYGFSVLPSAFRESINEMGVGRIVKGVNTTPDVGPNEIKKQAAKMGFKTDKDGRPPLLHAKARKNSDPNTLFNLGIGESKEKELDERGSITVPFASGTSVTIAPHRPLKIKKSTKGRLRYENPTSKTTKSKRGETV